MDSYGQHVYSKAQWEQKMTAKQGRSMKGLSYLKENKTFIKTASALNIAFLISALGDRLWLFAIGIFLHQLGGITWVAIHQLIDSLSKLLLTPVLGSVMDRMNRNKGMQSALLVNNVCISLSALIFFLCLSSTKITGIPWISTVYLVLAILFGSVSRVASEAQKTAFTKDWIVVVISKTRGARLSTQNAAMTVIDQAASLLTPLVAGLLLDSLSKAACCLVIIVWNILSWTIEAAMLHWIYKMTPDLAQRTCSELLPSKDTTPSPFSAYAAYFRQTSLRAAIGLALLYMTVLGFDNLALSYGASQGMSASTLGSFRSLGSLLGLLGALSYTTLERNIGLLWTGLIGLTLQNIFINLCSVSIFLPGSPFNTTRYLGSLTVEKLSEVKTSVTEVENTNMVSHLSFTQLSPSILVFFCGITLARYGLWIADPSITQIMQETIPEAERYSVFGAQTSICEMFSVLKDLLVIALPDTSNFGFLVIVSCCFVFAGYMLFFSYFISTYSCRRQKPNTTASEMTELRTPEEEHLLEKKIVEDALARA